MQQYPSMNGRYYRTSMDDIKNSEGWFKTLLLLGLIAFIPVFGQMTGYGYAAEWAHKAAWGVNSPMPRKIYSRPGSKMLRWGWFAIVITIVCAIIPAVVQSVSSAITGGGVGYDAASMYYSHAYVPVSGAAMFAGGLLGLVAFVLSLAASLFAFVGIMRMTVYDNLGAGLQFGKIWKMMKHDFGGLMRVFGMCIIIGLIISIVAFIIIGAVVTIAAMLGIFGAAGAATMDFDAAPAMAMLVFGAVLAALPFLLIVCYVLQVMSAFANIITFRAMGYWTRQFNVAQWGRKEDPMPFETTSGQGQAYYATPQQPEAQPAPRQPEPDVEHGAAGATATATAAKAATTAAAGPAVHRPEPEQPTQPADTADVAADLAGDETPPDYAGDAAPIADSELAVAREGAAAAAADVEGEQAAAGDAPVVAEEAAAKACAAPEVAEEEPMSEDVKKEETQYASAGDVVKQNIGTGGAAHEGVHGGMAINVDEEKKKKASNPPAPPKRN